ncbi:DUF4870 domain-containing protein [Abyssalbus ytuae]|uniref:DUF4870 domain-containing protein n=1 Tax=Abyssalbus ytuae TaxID=2926907 RepID=A0A9E6ZY64_9FLAO|nr:hypothetical protein [Abyssalbus ytuae]UOB17362.1 hypothetical protein MQE35_16695 [Abyssalbus ytuae]
MENLTVKEGKTAAIISYLTIIGAIIAVFMNQEKQNTFARFHIRQAFGIHVAFWLLGYFIGMFNSWLVTSGFWIFFFVLWIYGFLGALQERKTIMPLLGESFQKWFTFIK